MSTLSCCIGKTSFFENLQYTTDFLGFQFRGILNLCRILFHALVVFGPEHDFMFKSASAYCGLQVFGPYITGTTKYFFSELGMKPHIFEYELESYENKKNAHL